MSTVLYISIQNPLWVINVWISVGEVKTKIKLNVFSFGVFYSKMDISNAIYFLTRTLKQSIFGRLIPKPIVEWLFASYILIFVKKYLAGLNTLRTPPY